MEWDSRGSEFKKSIMQEKEGTLPPLLLVAVAVAAVAVVVVVVVGWGGAHVLV